MCKDSFIDRICETSTCLERLANKLIRKNRDLVLYGAGFWARQQYRALKELGVSFDAVAVDERFLPVPDFYGNKVVSLNVALSAFPNADVWLGFNLDKESFADVAKKIRNSVSSSIGEIFGCDCAKYENFENHNFTYESVASHANEFDWLFQRLSDDMSKGAMLSYINQRISGDYKYSEIGYDENHYFAADVLTPSKDDVFVDCGAFTGDTIEELFRIQKPSVVYAFEPDERNFGILSEKFKNDDSVICLNKGAYDKPTILRFSSGCADASKVNEFGNVEIQTATIDSLEKKATFIKMDIEGSELAALHGAEQTIKTCHPKLAISVYHKFEDLLEIPQYIYSLDSSYKFYMRRHSHLVHEFVLYAV